MSDFIRALQMFNWLTRAERSKINLEFDKDSETAKKLLRDMIKTKQNECRCSNLGRLWRLLVIPYFIAIALQVTDMVTSIEDWRLYGIVLVVYGVGYYVAWSMMNDRIEALSKQSQEGGVTH
jgi:hypothetical protein